MSEVKLPASPQPFSVEAAQLSHAEPSLRRPLRIALFGFGTVGSSVARILVESRPETLELTHIFNRGVARKRVGWVPESVLWSEDADAVLAANVDVVVELAGGLDPAGSWVRRALSAGKSVVTANKKLIAYHGAELERIVEVIASDEERWATTMAVEEYGLSPAVKSPILAALNTSAAFVVCGLVPLVSYLVGYSLGWCVVATGLVFFGIGATKSRWSLAGWGRSGLETLAIGMSAAGLSFLIGYGLRALVKMPM